VDANFTHSGFAHAMIAAAGGGSPERIIIAGDDRVHVYTEPAGVPTLTTSGAGGGLPSGWSSVTGYAGVGPYFFTGGSKIFAGDTQITPVIRDLEDIRIQNETALNEIFIKAMAVFMNRLYFAYGYRNPADGGSALGYFTLSRSATLSSLVGGQGLAGSSGAGTSIEFLKGDH
jgi:hypothetical protein